MTRAASNQIVLRANEKLQEITDLGTGTPSPFALDYSLYETWNITLLANSELTESNLPTSGTYTRVIVLRVTGNFTLTFPAAWSTEINGVYVGTEANLIVVQYFKSTVYKVEISQPD